MMRAWSAFWLTVAPQDGPMNVAETFSTGTSKALARPSRTTLASLSVSFTVCTRMLSLPILVTLTPLVSPVSLTTTRAFCS